MEAARVLPEHQWPGHALLPLDATATATATVGAVAAAAAAAAAVPQGGAAASEAAPTWAETDSGAEIDAGAGRSCADGRPAAPPPSLSERDQRVLAFERQWWKYAGAKEKAIRAEFGLSTTRYYQILNVLIDSREALMADPMLVRRLRRLRAQRRQARAGRSS